MPDIESSQKLQANAQAIQLDLDWFQQIALLRGKISFEQSMPPEAIDQVPVPDLSQHPSPYADLVQRYNMSRSERLVLLLALIPHVKPHLLDLLYMKNTLYDIPFTEFGGMRKEKYKGFLPTGETALYMLAGGDLQRRFALLPLFNPNHFFNKEAILSLGTVETEDSNLNGPLILAQDYVALLTTGQAPKPAFSSQFPARRIETKQEWDDLVLSERIMNGIEEIRNYIEHGKLLKEDFDFGRRIRPGFKVLFTGPPGTGKTMTATLLGKQCKMDVYKVDLSMVVSKYIGETEKNLSRVFDQAESKNWILFFDEADALFGKRSQVADAHDRYANQEVSFLLQRMERFDGLVILCSNFRKNIDEAFYRRFQLVLDFELPDVQQRHQLWSKSRTEEFQYAPEVDLYLLAEQYELSAASIVNVLHHAMLKCLSRNDRSIHLRDLQTGIRMEMIKEGKSIV